MPLAKVRVDATWQPIHFINDEKVKSYVDRIQKDCELPPIQVQENEGGFYVVLEGHHRFMASQECSFTHIPAEIIPMPSMERTFNLLRTPRMSC